MVCRSVCWTAANGSGIDAALGFGVILDVLGFLCLFRDGVKTEW